VTIHQESHIEFDFTNALRVVRHDVPSPAGDGNTIWKGVDFRIELPDKWLWVEVKSWDLKHIEQENRDREQASFYEEMRGKTTRSNLVSKFLGTTAYLSWKGGFLPSPVLYLVVLQPPTPLDKALLGTFAQKLKSSFTHKKWTHPIECAVLDVHNWNRTYPEQPAKIL
jgi:hypothetical protein